MGKKKRAAFLSSSEDEFQVPSARETRGLSRSTSKSLSSSSKKFRGKRLKEGDGGGSDFRCSRNAEDNKFSTLSEGFCDCLPDFHLTRGNQKALWVDKYRPCSVAELAVHKKKVEEVKNWLEQGLMAPKGRSENILLLTGQAGIGKSATVRVIASQLGAQLCEWTTPIPTLWQEHVHNVNSGLRYMSKLDEFEGFTEKVGKYSLLYPSAGATSRSTVVLIDDLPVTNGRVAFGRLKNCLATLSRSTQLPVIILLTEFHKTEFSDISTNQFVELVSLLERCGAHKIAFNPITVISIKKVLSMLCQEEKCNVTSEQIDQIAKASGGDIRNAITSLQFWCLIPDNMFISPVSTLMEMNTKLVADFSGTTQFTGLVGHEPLNSTYLPCGRDETLNLFHALGKFLHNKREAVDELNLGSESMLKDKYVRKPLKMDAPENVLSQAYVQARPFIDFLHENVLDFVSDEAIEDAWLVTSYLSDADCLFGGVLHMSRKRILDNMYEAQTLFQSAASSIAIRGVLYGNSQPVSSRWHTIRSPKLWQIEHLAKQHLNQLINQKIFASNGLGSSMSQTITEYRPSSRWLNSQTTDNLGREISSNNTIEEAISSKTCSFNLEEINFKQESEDEIEDW